MHVGFIFGSSLVGSVISCLSQGKILKFDIVSSSDHHICEWSLKSPVKRLCTIRLFVQTIPCEQLDHVHVV